MGKSMMLWVLGAIMLALLAMLIVGLVIRPNDGKQSPTGSREGPILLVTAQARLEHQKL
jgi:hypothetical protein